MGSEEEGLLGLSSKSYELAFYAILLVWLLYMAQEAVGYRSLEDKLLPILMFVVGVPLVVIQLVITYRPGIKEALTPEEAITTDDITDEIVAEVETITGPDVEDLSRSASERQKYGVYMFLWVVALPVLMFYLGMGWALLVFTFSFSMFFTGNVVRSLAATLIMVLGIYLLFMRLLRVILWEGALRGYPPFFRLVDSVLGGFF